jgi:hypothetical protein
VLFADPLPERRYGALIGQITGNHAGRSAVLFNILFYPRQSCPVTGSEYYGSTHAREPMGDCLANASGRSRDHRDLSR